MNEKMGRTKDLYIDHLNDLDKLRREGRHRYDINTLDQEDSQNREIQDRKPDKNKPKERDSDVFNDKRKQV